MKKFEKYLIEAVIAFSFLGIIGLIPSILSILLGILAGIYLILGWKLFSPDENKYFLILPFLVSYLIVQTIVTILFGINLYPLKNTFAYVTATMLLIAIIILLVNKKRLSDTYPINKYITRLIICFMFSFTPLWTEILRNS